MNSVSQRNNLAAELKFTLLSLCCWAGAIAIGHLLGINTNIHSPIFISFISLAIACAMILLNSAGYFYILSLFPRRSDIILATLAVTSGGLLASFITLPLQQGSFINLLCLSLLSGTSASLVFCTEEILGSLLKNYRQQLRIVLDLDPSEQAPVIEELASRDLLNHIQIMSRQDLEAELNSELPISIALIIISQTTDSLMEKEDCLLKAFLKGIPIVDYRTFCAKLSGRIRLGHLSIWQYILDGTPKTEMIRVYFRIKNFIEPFVAMLLLLLFSPLMLFIAISVRLSCKGSAILSQSRIGYKQKTFQLYKFRTIQVEKDPGSGAAKDLKISRLGKFLRKYRIDELPQLWNVFKGEMSFIGPDPEQPIMELRMEELLPAFTLRTLIKPGITGWARINTGHPSSTEESKIKLEYDLYYIQNMSLRLDLIILIKTVSAAIFGRQDKRNTVIVELAEDDLKKSAEFLN